MVAYTDPTSGNDANAIQDAAGNDAASLDSTIITNNFTPAADTTSPTFSYAVASFDCTQVFFVYDEVLSSTTAETSAFTVNMRKLRPTSAVSKPQVPRLFLPSHL